MKKIIPIIFVLMIFMLAGCAKSLIKLVFNDDRDSHLMFGKNPERNFFVPIVISDSLKEAWENEVFGGFTNNSVIYKDSIIITGDLGGRIHCFNIVNGKQVGVIKTKGSVYSTPLIINYKLVYALVDQTENITELIYYDMYNGIELKTIEIEGRVLSQMILDHEDLVLCTENGYVKKYSGNGDLIWEYDAKSGLYANSALIDSNLLIANVKGEIISLNSARGKLNYRIKFNAPFFSGITIDSSLAYIADNEGVLYSFNVTDGKKLWSYKTSSRIIMNPAVDRHNVYIGNLRGDLYALDKLSGDLLWKTDLDGSLNSTPLITENLIVISNLFKKFSFIDKTNGFCVKDYELDARCRLSPVIINKRLIIGYDDGVLKAYDFVF